MTEACEIISHPYVTIYALVVSILSMFAGGTIGTYITTKHIEKNFHIVEREDYGDSP